jgi:hypothetical protein
MVVEIIAWFLLVCSVYVLVSQFRKATNGGPNANQVPGWHLILDVIGFGLQIAVYGRVLGWW